MPDPHNNQIRAAIFDLDGTLVQTEKLKALSYARAAVELCPYSVSEESVIEAFKDVVGLSRREVATALVARFDLAEKASARMDEFGVNTPWQAFVQVRLAIYETLLADPQVILDNQWPHNMALLAQVRKVHCKVGLATMSHCRQANRVLEILGLQGAFDFVATRDDVEKGKPDPEIYNLVLAEMRVRPEETLAVEDSPAGVQAALNAGVHVLAVSTPFTRKRLIESNLVPASHLVLDPTELEAAVRHIVGE